MVLSLVGHRYVMITLGGVSVRDAELWGRRYTLLSLGANCSLVGGSILARASPPKEAVFFDGEGARTVMVFIETPHEARAGARNCDPMDSTSTFV